MKNVLTIICLFVVGQIYGQEVNIKIKNGSFEDGILLSSTPIITHWDNLDYFGETPVDVFISDTSNVNNLHSAQDGNRFIGMVVRSKESWEGIGQQLRGTLSKGQIYQFSFYTSFSKEFLSSTKSSENNKIFSKPAVIRVYGAKAKPTSHVHEEHQLLYESKAVNDKTWKKHSASFACKYDINYLIFEAYWDLPVIRPYDGHVFIDSVSDFKKIGSN